MRSQPGDRRGAQLADPHAAVGDVGRRAAGAEHRDLVLARRGDARVDLLAVPGDPALGLGQLERPDHRDPHGRRVLSAGEVAPERTVEAGDQ